MATITKTRAAKAPKPVKKAERTAKVAKAVAHGPAPERHLARTLAGKVLKKVAARALESGATAARAAVERASDQSFAFTARRLPVQRSIDVAVPIRVAWHEWMQFELIPEGIARVVDIEREGDELVGTIRGAKSSEWVAQILDERDQQSFAWHSREGSDCAGLITFHELGERLTRIELDLDIQPTGIGQGVTFNTHVADRRAEADLRRFKARLEFINPDIYESDESSPRRSGSSKQRARRKQKPDSKGNA
jgi:uncharacterized membrane protein